MFPNDSRDTATKIIETIYEEAYLQCDKGNYTEQCPQDIAIDIACRMYLVDFKDMRQEVCETIVDDIDYIACLAASTNIFKDSSELLHDKLFKTQHVIKEAIYKAYKHLIDSYYYEAMHSYDTEVKPIFDKMLPADFLQREN